MSLLVNLNKPVDNQRFMPDIFSNFNDPHVGHLGYNTKTNIKFITKLTSVPIK